MAAHEQTNVELSGELEEIATSAAERLRALTDGDLEREADQRRRVGESASRAIAAGVSLSTIADAEQIGHRRAREELGPDYLRRVQRAAGRMREAEHEHEQAVVRAVHLGLAHRDVAAAARVTHGTVRAIVARTRTVFAQPTASTTTAVGARSGQQIVRRAGADRCRSRTNLTRACHVRGSE